MVNKSEEIEEVKIEKFDLFDADRLPLNQLMSRGQKVPKDCYRQVVHVVLFNSKGEMLIQQRQPFKSPYPNMWDVTVGGSVIAGENSRAGAHRELLEELGIDYDFTNHRPSLTVNFVGGFDDYYIVNLDVELSDVKLQTEEVQKVQWATLNKVKKLIKSNEFIGYNENFIEFLFDFRSKQFGVHRS